MRVRRLEGNPIVHPGLDDRIGTNIQGPSPIRVPDWIPHRLGRYYLYFADHKGDHIRLAVADAIDGPWRIHRPGALSLADSGFPTEPIAPPADGAEVPLRPGFAPPGTPGIPDALADATTPHVASPDVHVDDANRRIVMYFHGLEAFRVQRTRVAVSADGLRFEARAPILGPSYFRAFRHGGHVFAIAMPGLLYRSTDGIGRFEPGPDLFGVPLQRHVAVRVRGERLQVFWTRVGDVPERILVSDVDLRGPWTGWRAGPERELLRPERDWEGAGEALAPSWRGAIAHPVNQLRDPAILEEDGRTWLFYAVAGESGIAIAELHDD
ncbi:MAG: hypothetical protein RJA99_1929 [Pseudomonadota bacterium]|jgi:hypothetical protein